MDLDKISQQLSQASRSGKRSMTAQFMDVLDSVETSISSGVAHEEIVAILNENGFELSLKSFRNLLYRARQKANKSTTGFTPPPSRPITENTTTIKHESKEAEDTIDLKALSRLGAKNK